MTSDKIYWDNMAGQYDCHTKKFSKVYKRIIQLIQKEILKQSYILDIGTGTGEIPFSICYSAFKIEAIDYSEEMIKIALEKLKKQGIDNVTFRAYDGVQLPYPNKTFDIVLMSNLLHVIHSPEKVLNEASRVLKDQGTIIVPCYLHNDSLRTRFISWILKQKGHPIYTRFSSKSLKEFIEQNKFRITNQTYLKGIMPVSFVVAEKTIK